MLAVLVIVNRGSGSTIVVVTVEELFPGVVSTVPLGAFTVAVFGIALPAVDAMPEMTMSQVAPFGSDGMVPVSKLPDSDTFAAPQIAPAAGVTATTPRAVKLPGTASLIVALTTPEGPAFETRRKKRTWVPTSTGAMDAA